MNISDLILYKTNQFIIVNKPVGIPIQPDKTEDKSLIELAEIYCKSKLFLIHRLDRPASGVVVFAKNKKAAATFSEQFQKGKIEKNYLAVVKNKPEAETGTLEHFLKKDSKTKKSFVVKPEDKAGKKAILEYKTLASSTTYHLLEVDLKTGRFHQIRAQLGAIGSPIKGDVKYGFKRGNKDRSIHLHAWKLNFNHPVTNEKMEFVADVPAEDVVWQALMKN